MSFINNYLFLNFFSFIWLAILLLKIANSSIYLHSHQVEDGQIITHAHPYEKEKDNAPIKSHEHNSSDYLLLTSFEYFLFTHYIFLCTVIISIKESENYFLKNLNVQVKIHCIQNKSPPFKIVI